MKPDQDFEHTSPHGKRAGPTRLAAWSIAITLLSVASLFLRGRPFPYPLNLLLFLGGLVAAGVLALAARRRARSANGERALPVTALVLVAIVLLAFLVLVALLWLALRNFQ